jgi:hypothetical protein
MCCFSRAVEKVADTNIFARSSKDGRQFLVYSMMLSAKEDLAMILPIPVPKAPKEDAVKFINLEKYQDFFKELFAGFPVKKALGNGRGSKDKSDEPKLKVVEVGSYEASFVPTVKDFSRLDERFRLPADVWDKLPQYKEFGFTVFKLKKGASKVHPMAFEFPRAKPKQLFFPTVHIHDGKVHDKADFDHALYCQMTGGEEYQDGWEESPQPANLFMKIDKAQGILEPNAHVYRKMLRGKLKNEDIVV